MESQIFLEYLLSENQNLLFRYNHKKSVLLHYLKRLMERLDKDELNHFYLNISMKYDEPPPQPNPNSTKTLSEAIQDLLEVNSDIQALNNHVQDDIMTLEDRFKFLNKTEDDRNQIISSQEPRSCHLQNTLDCQTARDIRYVALNSEMQKLLESQNRIKEQLQFAQNHQQFNENLIEELAEEVDKLRERVKILEEREACSKPLEHADKENAMVLETEVWEENINVLNQQLSEEINRGDDLNGQLKKTQRLYFIYKNIIKNYCKETRALRNTVKKLEEKLDNNQTSVYRSSFKSFSPKWKKHQAEIILLISQKRLAWDSSEGLKEQLDRAKYIYSVFRIMLEKMQMEVDDLYEIIRWLDDRLRKISPSLTQRICRFFGITQVKEEMEMAILTRQKREAKCRVKDLQKQLLDVKRFYSRYEHITGKIKEEKNILQKRLRTFDEKLKTTLQGERIRAKTFECWE